MSFQAKPGQALLLWNLLITGEEPAMSKAKPALKPAARKSLAEAGLLQLQKRGRSQHFVLTDKAWDWAVENFDVELAKTPTASPLLQKLLSALGQHLQSHHVSLSSFLCPVSEVAAPLHGEVGSAAEKGHEAPETTLLASDDLEEKIRQAYTKIASNSSEIGVRLSKLRQYLKDFSTVALDQALRAMQLAGELILMPLEDPTAISPEEDQAAVDIDGYRCHVVQRKR